MLNSSILKNILIAATQGKEYPITWSAFGSALNSYVTANAIISGTYSSGMIPGTPPVVSPLSGSVQYVIILNIPTPALIVAMQAASSIPNTNGLRIIQAGLIPLIQSSMIVIQLSILGTVALSSPLLFPMAPGNTNVDMSEMNRSQVMFEIAQYIVERITGCIITPPAVPAVGSDGSVGGTVSGLSIQ